MKQQPIRTSFAMDSSNDEVLALQGIFCGAGEFEMLEHSDSECSFCICVHCQALDQSEDSLKICIQFNLPIGYPLVLPSISLSCKNLTRNSTNQLRDELHLYAKTLEGQPMILDLVYWVKQNASKFRTLPSNQQKEDTVGQQGKDYTAILHIDHMRSRVRYVKTIVSWATELSLVGRLLFLHHLILVLLRGTENSVKEFLVRLRTQKVDVDSNGRSCKERMMTILSQGPHHRLSDEKGLGDFQVTECSSSLELKSVFKKADLIDVYEEAVLPKFNLLKPT